MADEDKNKNEAEEDAEKKDDAEEHERALGFSTPHKPRDGSVASTGLWLVTFTDIMALMLTFFVLLYTMSMPHEKEWSRLTSSLNDEFNKYYAHAPQWNAAPQDSINIDRVDFSRALDLDYLAVLLQQSLQDKPAAKDILFIPRKDRLIISMPSDVLFNSGQADVLDEGRRTLFTMGEALSKIRNHIEVVGHTDPRPIQKSAGAFDSNWHLSIARAANVAGILQATGYRRPITIKGMGSARYNELSEDLSEERRLALSRRVDLVILKSTGVQRQVFDLGF